MTEQHTARCPCCGRFVEHDADGYYDRLDRDNESSHVAVFCDEQCAVKYHDQKSAA